MTDSGLESLLAQAPDPVHLLETCSTFEEARLVAALDAQHQIIDRRLDRAARWCGKIRKEQTCRARGDDRARYRAAFDWLVTQASRPEKLRLDTVTLLQIHEMVCGGGGFRRGPVAIGRFQSPPAPCVPALVDEVIGRAALCSHSVLEAAQIHMDILLVHPFADGNGRTARLAAALVMLRSGRRSTLQTGVEEFWRDNPSAYIKNLACLRDGEISRGQWVLEHLRTMMRHSLAASWFRTLVYRLVRENRVPDESSAEAYLRNYLLGRLPRKFQRSLDWQLTRLSREERKPTFLRHARVVAVGGQGFD